MESDEIETITDEDLAQKLLSPTIMKEISGDGIKINVSASVNAKVSVTGVVVLGLMAVWLLDQLRVFVDTLQP